ncbi:MAG: dihydropteroate synthase [Oscillospiraceae bacterium]|jgi:dihydropteroate synthase|nr:dihydropteroate synthase [Oscillospiraceae bacterium]
MKFITATREFPLGERTYIMGILNVTPDSFSDGGRFLEPAAALERAREMAAQGADILDIGGQSTRPGHTPVSAEEEWARLAPVFELGLTRIAPVSVDTFYPEVARKALEIGAAVINDVSGVVSPEMAKVVCEYGAGWVIMHNGDKKQENTDHRSLSAERLNLAGEVSAWLANAAKEAEALSVGREQICLDPGLGFGKSTEENLLLIKETRWITGILSETSPPGYAYLAGASRKRFIGAASGESAPGERDWGTVAAHTLAIWGGAHIVRVHHVKAAVDAARVADAVKNVPPRHCNGKSAY